MKWSVRHIVMRFVVICVLSSVFLLLIQTSLDKHPWSAWFRVADLAVLVTGLTAVIVVDRVRHGR
jgi:hypothetical protein